MTEETQNERTPLLAEPTASNSRSLTAPAPSESSRTSTTETDSLSGIRSRVRNRAQRANNANNDASNALPWKKKFGYGLGHVLNDLCASMWFTYLLLYFHK